MKKILMLVFVVCAFSLVNGQNTKTVAIDSLTEYTGKYKFPDGNPVTEINVTLENGVLNAVSAIGSSELKRREGDIFDIVAYGGTATFKRNGEGKISKVRVEVPDLDMEGEKTEGFPFSDNFRCYRK